MALPNADRAVVEPSKVRDYLLSSSHPIGRFKAVIFFALGYSAEHWQLLQDDLLEIARTGTTVPGKPSAFGTKFEVAGILVGPSGRSAAFKTVWLIRPEDESPTFVTAFPI